MIYKSSPHKWIRRRRITISMKDFNSFASNLGTERILKIAAVTVFKFHSNRLRVSVADELLKGKKIALEFREVERKSFFFLVDGFFL